MASMALALLLATPIVAAPTGLKIYPDRVDLDGKQDRQAVVVCTVDAKGALTDVTLKARYRLGNSKLAVRKGHLLQPLADGKTTLTVEYAGRSASIPVTVRNAATARPLSFRLDVMPIFMKAGCNSG